jgi:hypothetical protein
MKPTYRKVYGPITRRPDREGAAPALKLKLSDELSVEQKYNKAQLDRIQNAIRYTQQFKHKEGQERAEAEINTAAEFKHFINRPDGKW